MLTIHLDEKELWDDDKEEFLNLPECEVTIEHSLVSISKWESKYHKPFLTTDKSAEETLDYIRMMIIGKQPDNPMVLRFLTEEQIEQIGNYINDPMTATVFSEEDEKEASKKSTNKDKFVTSEEIYYWMTAQNIPFECQYWHLNRLITLIKICAIENKPKDKKNKKMTSDELARRRARMDAARKKYGG